MSKNIKKPKLTPKQKLFCDEWLIHRNGTRAYKKAYGVEENVAAVEAHKNLRKPNVKAYLEDKLAEIEKRYEISLNRVISEMARIGLSNTQDYIDEDGAVDLSKLSRDQAAAIQEITVEEYTEPDWDDLDHQGKPKQRNIKRTKIKLYDKKGALKDLGVHLGGFKSTHKHEGKVTLEQLLAKSIGDVDE